MGIFASKKGIPQKTVASTNLNKKIDKRLDMVAEIFADAAGSRWKETLSKMFCKKLLFGDLRYVTYLELKYNYENRFFSISYNLEMSTEVLTNQRFTEIGDCVFQVKSKGRLNIKDAEWVCKEFQGNAEERDRYLERLNNRLIIDRIVVLDMTKIVISHKKGSGKWSIRCESMVGSATWILIPPVINLIKPRTEECIQVIEFFELVSDAVANNTCNT